MSILIVGANGNMGERYQHNLMSLGVDFIGVDQECSLNQMLQYASVSDGILIATPTNTHLDLLEALICVKKPVLCEKPIGKDTVRVKAVLSEYARRSIPLSMVYQYAAIADTKGKGPTSYDFFRHGKDGLAWDCIQIIGMASCPVEKISLQEKSDVWKCTINGKALQAGAVMDLAYRRFIESWLREPSQDIGALIELHFKALEKHQEIQKRNGNTRHH